MSRKKDVWQGTLALMVLKTLEALGPMHGYGIARRIEQTSGHLLALNYGTLYPALPKLLPPLRPHVVIRVGHIDRLVVAELSYLLASLLN